jgi:hypothetical protein
LPLVCSPGNGGANEKERKKTMNMQPKLLMLPRPGGLARQTQSSSDPKITIATILQRILKSGFLQKLLFFRQRFGHLTIFRAGINCLTKPKARRIFY